MMFSKLKAPLVLASALLASLSGSALIGQDAKEEGFKTIFNGKNLDGWDGDARLWKVQDGVIHGETTEENKASGNTFLIWQGGKVSDFDLRITFRCTAANNSGIQYRSKHITEGKVRNKWVVRGYQHEIRNEVGFPNVSGFIYGEGIGRGRICLLGEKAVMEEGKKKVVETLVDEAEYKKLFKLDDWNEVRIVAKGKQVQHYMNGQLVLDFTDSDELALTEGVLALQLHAGKAMWAEFKNISIKEM